MASCAPATMAVPPMPEKCIFFNVCPSCWGLLSGASIARRVGGLARKGIGGRFFTTEAQRHREEKKRRKEEGGRIFLTGLT